MASLPLGRPWLHHTQHKNPGLHPPRAHRGGGRAHGPGLLGQAGRALEREGKFPPPHTWEGPPRVAEAVAEEEVRGGR